MNPDHEMRDKIKALAVQYREELRIHRRHFHQFPELSFEEKGTSAYLCRLLDTLNIPYRKGFAGFGIRAVLTGKTEEGPTIALRADMDALPVLEQTGLSFASSHTGIMHACGHDIHMASLVGVLLIMNELREEWNGKIVFLFQPGEESLPGGARLMIEEGALEDPVPDIVLGQHVQPGMSTGKLGFRPGKYMASGDEIYLQVKGKGGHAAEPDKLIDPIVIAAKILIGLKESIPQYCPEGIPTILSFGNIRGEGATNVIPDSVKLEGTFRTMDEDWRNEAHRLIRETAGELARSMGGSIELEIRKGYPFLVNDEETTRKAINFATQYLGEENIESLDIRMGAEDFAYYSQSYPSTFYRLGVEAPGRGSGNLHSSGFSPDEESLVTGSGAMAWMAYCFLCQE